MVSADTTVLLLHLAAFSSTVGVCQPEQRGQLPHGCRGTGPGQQQGRTRSKGVGVGRRGCLQGTRSHCLCMSRIALSSTEGAWHPRHEFSCQRRPLNGCSRLAELAACLGAYIPPHFLCRNRHAVLCRAVEHVPPRLLQMVRLFRQLQLIRLFRQLELRQRLKRVLAEGAVHPDGLTAAEAAVLTKYKHSESRVGQRLSGGWRVR